MKERQKKERRGKFLIAFDYSEDEKVVVRFLNYYELLSRRTTVRGLLRHEKSHDKTFLERRKKKKECPILHSGDLY